MSEAPYANPPHGVCVRELIVVQCERGEGKWRRAVTRVYLPGGELLAEHDEIHEDPEYAAFALREAVMREAAEAGVR